MAFQVHEAILFSIRVPGFRFSWCSELVSRQVFSSPIRCDLFAMSCLQIISSFLIHCESSESLVDFEKKYAIGSSVYMKRFWLNPEVKKCQFVWRTNIGVRGNTFLWCRLSMIWQENQKWRHKMKRAQNFETRKNIADVFNQLARLIFFWGWRPRLHCNSIDTLFLIEVLKTTWFHPKSSHLYSLTPVAKLVRQNKQYLRLALIGDATIRTKYQFRTKDRFGPKKNSAQNFNYFQLLINISVYKIFNNCKSSC